MDKARANKKIGAFLCVLLFKIVLELGFYYLLTVRYPYYIFQPDIWKYLNGVFWSFVLFMGINCQKKASAFFLLFMYLFQIIPITVVYGLYMGDAIYYNTLCAGFLLCEFIVLFAKRNVAMKQKKAISKWMIPAFTILAMLLAITIYRDNGLPSLTAINLYDVYELRANNQFVIGHYMNKVLTVSVSLFLPILIAKSVIGGKYITAMYAAAIQILLYLYTGHKTYFFSVVLVIVISVWSKRDKFFTEFFSVSCIGVSFVTFAGMIFGAGNIFDRLYDIAVRRVMFTPAALKFIHYDYFSRHVHLGMQGVVPVAMLLNPNQAYIHVKYPFEIGRIYFNAPNMSADTGSFVEGFARFGDFGTILVMVFIGVYLWLMDSMQARTDFRTVVSFFICPIYALAEAQIIGSLFFGSWFFITVILLFYNERPVVSVAHDRRTLKKRVRSIRLRFDRLG